MVNRFILLFSLLILTYPIFAQSGSEEGFTYDGKYKKGLRHGQGVGVWSDGSRYEGMWKYGAMNGKGTYTSKGNKYEGMWKNGKKEGTGVLTYADGSVYTGEFRDDQRSGTGKMKFADGSSHEGQWKNDMANGSGKHIWTSGTQYIGNWKDNQMHGKGILIYFDGKVDQGKFKNNEYVPCDCPILKTVVEEFNDSEAVFVGKVLEVYANENGDYEEIIMEIEKYCKGEFGFGRRVILTAGYSSCDNVFYDDESYLVYAKSGTRGIYQTTKCSRTNLAEVSAWEIEKLNEVVPCKSDAPMSRAALPSNEADFVCGCDGETYRNPYQAKKSGIQSWKKGKCEENN